MNVELLLLLIRLDFSELSRRERKSFVAAFFLYFHFVLTFFLFNRTNENKFAFFSFECHEPTSMDREKKKKKNARARDRERKRERDISNTTQWIDFIDALFSEWLFDFLSFSFIFFSLNTKSGLSISEFLLFINERTSTNQSNLE